ncbi:transmembrane protein 17-like [Neocloeon triangulifer]|uniref:transmembrane protein 17-like n=1 Tax=Neocloeon triangulifer TaxID=2078957 RepID=UPI00286EE4D2|nr:transmembrane protein 17-like [Neocloeon triangulifer]
MRAKSFSTSWRKSVTSWSENVFPGISSYKGDSFECSLVLQMLLYFDAVFFPFWAVTIGSVYNIKYDYLSSTYKFISITMLASIFVVQIVRLYLGYLGNLTEKIPELAAFWMLSVLLQLPMELFLILSRGIKSTPPEYTVNIILLLLLVLQLLSGYQALTRAAQHHADRFRQSHQ